MKRIVDSLPASSIAKQGNLYPIEDELPFNPMDWPAQWLYMYLEQTAIFEVDYEMEPSLAKKFAEEWVRDEYSEDRELGIFLDEIVDWESFLPSKYQKRKK